MSGKMPWRRRKSWQRGAVLMAALVVLAIAAMLFVSWIRTAASERLQVRMQEFRLQADLLADSALDRAAAQLAHDPNYPGESWQLPAEQFAGRGAAAVEIRVEFVPDQPRQRLVRVQAVFPSGGDRGAQRSKQAVVNLSP